MADSSGLVQINCSPELKAPVVVEVSAEGYQARSVLVREDSASAAEVILRRQEAEMVRDTVSANELLPEVQEKSFRLQKEGLAALHRADYGVADSLFRQALALTPSSTAIYNNLGVTCARRSRMDLAIAWLEKALALDPYNPCVSGNLGILRWAQNQFEESYRLLKFALGNGYRLKEADYVLGLLALRRGSTNEAIKHLSKVSAKDYRDRDLFLSVAFQKKNRQTAALRSHREYIKKNPVAWLTASYEPRPAL